MQAFYLGQLIGQSGLGMSPSYSSSSGNVSGQTGSQYNAYVNSSPISHLSGTGNAIYSLDQGLMANNANYQSGINNNQAMFMNTASNEAQNLGSQIQSSSKKGSKGK